MMKNEQMIVIALVVATLLAAVLFMKDDTKATVKETNGTACRRTGVVPSQAEITGLQL